MLARTAMCAAAVLAATAATPAPAVRGLDHIPLAVRDLSRAERDFVRLGFVLKPGRPHADGISNAHVKFPDRTEIELITARAPSDALATEYARWLRDGDAAESWSLYAPDLGALTARLAAMGLAPSNDGEIVTFAQRAFVHRSFFADREPSPTDRPAYFAHPNTAYRLQGVWVTDNADEQRLIVELGATRERDHACAPFATTGRALRVGDGEIHRVPGAFTSASARSIVAATVLVRRSSIAKAILARAGVRFVERCASLWIRPAHAHGL